MNQIPKKIHISWLDDSILENQSPLVQNGIANLIRLNPNWQICFEDNDQVRSYLKCSIDRSDYLLLENKHIVEFLDVWRLVKLYNEGGIYLDLDRYCDVVLDEVIPSEVKCVLPTYLDTDFSQDIMISAAGNPIYQKAYDLIMHRRRQGSDNIYYLGPQTYMHAVTQTLCGTMIEPNPGIETMNMLREQINRSGFMISYRENPPSDTYNCRKGMDTIQQWEHNKRSLYADYCLNHWTGEW